VPTVNIGNRQKGRLSAPSVINCDESELSIRTALETALGNAHRQLAKRKETPYGSPGAAKRMIEVIENYHLPSLAKHFQDA
jgi:UDP-N-acetylglucosamine 2-epimerase